MRTALGQARAAEPALPVTVAATTREIPYDYVATLELTGQFGNRVQGVVNVSVDGAFVATAIGYSLLPPRDAVPRTVSPESAAVDSKRMIGYRQGLFKGAKTIPAWLTAIFSVPAAGNQAMSLAAIEEASRCLALRFTCFDFLYTIIDAGTGRELSNAPIHSMAGLGNEAGFRPFREFAKPMLFMPRSSIRIEIVEQSQGPLFTGGLLYFVLHGYKLLGYGAAA